MQVTEDSNQQRGEIVIVVSGLGKNTVATIDADKVLSLLIQPGIACF